VEPPAIVVEVPLVEAPPNEAVSTSQPAPPRFAKTLAQHAVDWGSHAVLAQGVAMIAFMAYIVWVSYTPMFWVDQWSFLMELMGNHGHYSAALVWRQHDDHRIPLPKLFYLIDLYWFHGKNIFLLVVIFCIQLLNAAWLGFVYIRLGRLSGATWRTAVGLTAICLFAFRQVENFLFGSDLPLVIPCLGATVAISGFGLYCQALREQAHGRRAYLMLSWSAAILSGLSLTNGLLIWPILLVLALVWRLPKRVFVMTASITVVLAVLWSIGYSAHISRISVSTITKAARFLQIMYGSSWSFINDSMGLVLAAITLPVAAFAAIWFLTKRRDDIFGVVLISQAGFMLGSSFATALGRISFGVEYGRAERYQTGALLFWCFLAVLIIRQIPRMEHRQAWLLASQTVIATIFLVASTRALQCIDNVRLHEQVMMHAEVAMQAGVNDPPWLLYPIVRPWMSQDMLLFADFLRERKWSIFADRDEFPLGREFTRFYKVVSPALCRGTIDEVAPMKDPQWPGFRVSGWTWDYHDHRPGKAVAWVNTSGRLIGAARSGFSRPDVRKWIPAFDRDDTGYVGYIPGDLESATADAYVILADGFSACPLSQKPITFDLKATEYPGPQPTGSTRSLVRHNLPASSMIEMLNGKWVVGATQLKAEAGQPLVIRGWITDRDRRAGSAGDVAVDGMPFAATYGIDRPDIGSFLGSPLAARCGLQATIPSGLSRGKHQLTLRVVSRDQDLFFESLPVTLWIE